MHGVVERLARLWRDPANRWLGLRLSVIAVLVVVVELLVAPRVDRASGDSGWVLVHAVLLALLAGATIWVLLRGVARRGEQVAEALRQSEERFRNLTALSADWFWETDADHRVSWLAGGASVGALFGGARTGGNRLWEVPGLVIDPAALEAMRARFAERAPFLEVEFARPAADGARIVHVVSGEPRTDAHGAFAGYRGVGRDVTHQRAAERALAEAKQRLDLAVEGGALAIWDCDVATDTIFLSGEWAVLFGRAAVPETTKSAGLLADVHPEDGPVTRAAFLRALKGEDASYSAEYRIRTIDGQWRWVHGTGRVTERNAAGRAVRISGTAADIDARRRAEEALREAEERYRVLADFAPDAILVHSGGRVEYANRAAARLFGAGSPQHMAGTRIESLVHPEEHARLRERMRFHESGPGVSEFERRRLLRLDGSEVQMEAASVSYLERGRPVVQSVLRDRAGERRARDLLVERDRRFADVVSAAAGFVWETDAGWAYTYVSPRVHAVLGYAPADLLGRTPRSFMPIGEARAQADWFAQRLAHGAPFRDVVQATMTRAGRAIWLSMNGVPVLDAAGRLQGYRGTATDVTARRQAEERLEFFATRDPLTGLPTRTQLADRVQRAIVGAARGGSAATGMRAPVAVLVLDLDRFRLVNEVLGHEAGDGLLRAVSERLAHSLGRGEALGRLGGDAFVLLGDGAQTGVDAAALAQRVLVVLGRPFPVEGRVLSVGASIGIAQYPADGRDAATLLRHAESAMIAAKWAGRGTFRAYADTLGTQAADRLQLENDLRGALARGELELNWQPVVRSLPQGGTRIVGAEALVRWRHPERGRLAPDLFIEMAEDSGLIRELGEWMLERMLSQIAAWRRRFGDGLWYALNVSAAELAQGGVWVKRIGESLAAHGVPGHALEFEVTERVLVSHLPASVETLRGLGALGVRIAVDDFGTGYCGLSYLRRLPIDKLKIDRSFLRELDSHPADAGIVQAIATLAHGLGLSLVAEGVETAAQCARLLELGCEEWQGHHFSEPLEPAAFERLLVEREAAAS